MASPTKMATSSSFSFVVCTLFFFSLTTALIATPSGDEEPQNTSQESQAASEESSIKPDANTGVIDYRIRDSETGYAVQATLKYADVEEGWVSPRSATTDEHGRIRLALPPAHYLIEISAPGYPPRRTHDKLIAGARSAGQIMMSPLSPPEELRPEVMESKLFKGYGLWQGYVVDAVTFKPLPGARVRLEEAQLETRTNERGYFSISARVVDRKDPLLEAPVMDTMIIELAGYKTYIHKNEPVPNEGGLIDFSGVDLEPGQGTTIHDNTPAPLRDPEEYKHHQSGEPGIPTPEDPRVLKWLSEKPGKGMALGTGESLELVTPLAISLPSQIIVGLNCGAGRRTCTTASPPYSLEEYVQRGLDEEWDSGWDENALKAGAVAYRSYGAFYVANKVCPYVGYNGCTAAYDICSSIYCQVFDEDRPTKTKNAAIATAGVVLTRDGTSIFEGEHSAENNAVDCPDQQTGSPSGSWPCMRDGVCAGAAANGHGRGMCQWGSQRWATGKNKDGVIVTTPRNWQCILDHYYNDNGNYTGAGTELRTARIEGPGGNGRLLYGTCTFGHLCGDEIWTMNPDPALPDSSRITNDRINDRGPSWDPGGERIAWERRCPEGPGSCIFKINADKSGMTQLTNYGGWPSGGDSNPTWSTSGDGRIIFVRDRVVWDPLFRLAKDFWVMNSDGTNPTSVALDTYIYSDTDGPAWSPDGTKIIYSAYEHPYYAPIQLFVMNTYNWARTQLTFSAGMDKETPSWSPDGTRIAFTGLLYGDTTHQVWMMNSDASGQPQQITSSASGASNFGPRWSPDGSKIGFRSNRDHADPSYCEVYVMDANGNNQTKVTNNPPISSAGGTFDWRRCARFDVP